MPQDKRHITADSIVERDFSWKKTWLNLHMFLFVTTVLSCHHYALRFTIYSNPHIFLSPHFPNS